MYNGSDLIRNYVPNDNCKQNNLNNFVLKILKTNKINKIMDLGCGTGGSVDLFREITSDASWVGLDIDYSEEVKRRKRRDAEFVFYDGVKIPFNDSEFDLIYTNQVFEHVEYPFELMKEVNRVLKPGGFFIGSLSQYELFHGNSTINFTPYGFSVLFRNTSLKYIELRPGIDLFTLLFFRFFKNVPILSWYLVRSFVKQSFFNSLISFIGKILRKSNQDINLIKLLFCGQFNFIAQKRES